MAAKPQKLQCVNCWISSPVDGKSTHCRHCGEPLYLSDGRRVIDVQTAATREAAAFAAAGYDPHAAPAAAEAAVVLAPTSTGPTNWVSVSRVVLVVTAVTSFIQLGLEASENVVVRLPTGDPYQLHTGLALSLELAGGLIGVAIGSWLLRFMVFRVLAVIGAIGEIVLNFTAIARAPVDVTAATTPLWNLAFVALGTVYVVVLLLSIASPPPVKSKLRA